MGEWGGVRKQIESAFRSGYGEPRFARSLAAHANPNPAILTERLVSDLSSFIGGTDKLKDDATIFAVRTG